MAFPIPIFCLCLASPLMAQPQGGVFDRHKVLDSVAASSGFGQAVALLADVNLDGVDDVLIGAPYEDGASVSAAGAVHLRGGGSSIFAATFYGTQANGMFGWSVANAGLCSGDIFDDFLVGAPGENNAYIFDAFSGTLWLTVSGPAASSFGWSVVGLGDLNADGVDDFAVGAPMDSPGGLTEAGSVYVYSGADGSPLASFHGAASGDHFGYALTSLAVTPVTPLGSSSASPPRLLAVGAPDTILGGHVAVYDAASSALIFAADGSVNAVGSAFGYALTAVADADADGVEELAVGAPHYATGLAHFDVGRVEIFSPLANASLHILEGDLDFEVFGRQLSSADVNGDGLPELVVRSYKTTYGHIEIFSGADSALLYEIEGSPELAGVGTGIAGGSDLTNDGYPDLVLGAPLADTAAGSNSGKAVVYGLHMVLSASNSSFDAEAGGFLTFQLDFPDSEQFRAYMLLASGGTGPLTQDDVIVPLSNDRIVHRMIRNNPMFPGQQGQLNLHGDAQVVFYVPPHLLDVLIDSTLYFAAVSADGSGVRASSVAVPLDIVSGSGSGSE